MRKIILIAGTCSVMASCSKNDDNNQTPPTSVGKGTWTVGANVYTASSSSRQYGTGFFSAFDASGNSIQFLFPDTSFASGTYTVVGVPASGTKEVGIIVSDQGGSNVFQTTGSDRVNAVVTRTGSGLSISVPTCRAGRRYGGTDSSTLSVALGPL